MAKRKGQKDKQRSTKHTHKSKDRVIRVTNIWESIREGEFENTTQNVRPKSEMLVHTMNLDTAEKQRRY